MKPSKELTFEEFDRLWDKNATCYFIQFSPINRRILAPFNYIADLINDYREDDTPEYFSLRTEYLVSVEMGNDDENLIGEIIYIGD